MSSLPGIKIVLLASLVLCPGATPRPGTTLFAQTGVEGAASPRTAQRATSTPYAGDLSIFEYPDRDKKLEIERVMDLLHITPGKTVADIGAGSGWFTVRAARRVGPAGTVLAEEINLQAIHFIAERARKEQLANIRTVEGSVDDARLPPASVDAMLLLKVYHEIARPIPFMRGLRASLRLRGACREVLHVCRLIERKGVNGQARQRRNRGLAPLVDIEHRKRAGGNTVLEQNQPIIGGHVEHLRRP